MNRLILIALYFLIERSGSHSKQIAVSLYADSLGWFVQIIHPHRPEFPPTDLAGNTIPEIYWPSVAVNGLKDHSLRNVFVGLVFTVLNPCTHIIKTVRMQIPAKVEINIHQGISIR